MVKVLMVLSSHKPGTIGPEGTSVKGGRYAEEMAHPYEKFKEAGFEVDFAAIKAGDANTNVDPDSVTEEELARDKVKAAVLADASVKAQLASIQPISAFDGKNYNGIMLVGGFGVMWDFYPNEELGKVCADCYESGGTIGSVCHGPIGLCAIKLSDGTNLVNGKTVAGFSDAEEAMIGLNAHYPTYPDGGNSCGTCLANLGGKYECADPWNEKAVIDTRVVSGQNPMSANKVGELMVESLKA